jgi:hypothetical protein
MLAKIQDFFESFSFRNLYYKYTGMNQQELSQTIKNLSGELHALILEMSNEGIPALQHELIKNKCVALYDQLLRIETVDALENVPVFTPPPVTIEKKAVEPEVTEKPPVPPSLFNDLPPIEEKPEMVIPTEIEPEQEEPVIIEKTATEIQNEIIDEIIEIREEQKEQQQVEQPKDILSEISLHEKIASVLPKTDLTERFTESIPSLKSAINVNLKIAIVNDLFNENTVEYVKAIDKLNNSGNIHEAMRYLTELKHTYNWENDNNLVKELESLVNKRFA